MTLQVLFIISVQYRQIFFSLTELLPSTLQGTLKTIGLTEASLVF